MSHQLIKYKPVFRVALWNSKIEIHVEPNLSCNKIYTWIINQNYGKVKRYKKNQGWTTVSSSWPLIFNTAKIIEILRKVLLYGVIYHIIPIELRLPIQSCIYLYNWPKSREKICILPNFTLLYKTLVDKHKIK